MVVTGSYLSLFNGQPLHSNNSCFSIFNSLQTKLLNFCSQDLIKYSFFQPNPYCPVSQGFILPKLPECCWLLCKFSSCLLWELFYQGTPFYYFQIRIQNEYWCFVSKTGKNFYLYESKCFRLYAKSWINDKMKTATKDGNDKCNGDKIDAESEEMLNDK